MPVLGIADAGAEMEADLVADLGTRNNEPALMMDDVDRREIEGVAQVGLLPAAANLTAMATVALVTG